MMLGGYDSMKKIYKVLMFGIMLAVLAVGSAVPSFAQDTQKEKEALYAKYIANYDKEVDKRKIAVQAGKEYLQKFGEGNEAEDPLIPYFKTNVPLLEQQIKDIEKDELDRKNAALKLKEEKELADQFNTSVKSKNLAQVFSSGKQIVDNKPEYLDVYIVLATIGYDSAVAKDNTYNNEAINYAKKAIQLIEKGEKSETYGASFGKDGKDGNYQYNDKENALGWLNYNIGYILTYNQKKPKEALPYLFEATKHESLPAKSSDIYSMIGKYYYDEVARLEKERQAIRQSLGNKDNEKSLELFAMQKGYADRGMDAYARAYNIENGKTDGNAEVKQRFYDTFKQLYTFRNNNKSEGADAYLATVKTKPLPNPTTPVQPIVDEADKEIPTTDETETDSTMDSTTKPATTTDKTKPAMDKKPSTTTPKPADKTDKPATKPTKP
jgi:hypothetical protein